MKAKILFFLLIITKIGLSQNLMPDKISFLKFTPFVDGKLDEGLTNLEEKKINHFFRFDNPDTDSIGVTYRMAYTPTHLYLYIATKADSITNSDRGFINGDGFKLLLAKPQKDSLTDEYYDIVFSATKDKNSLARKIYGILPSSGSWRKLFKFHYITKRYRWQ